MTVSTAFAELAAAGETLRNVRRDFPEWHRGREAYVFWAIDMDFPAIRARMQDAASHLGDLLLTDYRRQAHVTLELCGFPGDPLLAADEFDAGLLDAQCDRLRRAGLGAFELLLGDLDSFASAPYLQVADSGAALAVLRDCLAIDGRYRLENHYVPHVTVGLYADAWPASAVIQRLASFRSAGMVCCRIERISLMSYRPTEIAGALTTLGDFRFERGEMDWHEAAVRVLPWLEA